MEPFAIEPSVRRRMSLACSEGCLMDDGHRTGTARLDGAEAPARSRDLLATLTALSLARRPPASAGPESAERRAGQVLRLRHGLDDAEMLGFATHLTQAALIWRWIAGGLGIELSFDLDRAVSAPRDRTAPLARLVHELVTDCFERAFLHDRGGWIGLCSERDGDAAATITIHDRGQGQMRWSRARHCSKGARIVRCLSEDAGADLSLLATPCGGTTVRLRFPSPL